MKAYYSLAIAFKNAENEYFFTIYVPKGNEMVFTDTPMSFNAYLLHSPAYRIDDKLQHRTHHSDQHNNHVQSFLLPFWYAKASSNLWKALHWIAMWRTVTDEFDVVEIERFIFKFWPVYSNERNRLFYYIFTMISNFFSLETFCLSKQMLRKNKINWNYLNLFIMSKYEI